MLRMLRKNWMIAIALDLDVRKGVFVIFRQAGLDRDGWRDSRGTGTPVVRFHGAAGDTIHHKIKNYAGNRNRKTRIAKKCVRENTQRFTNSLEQIIRRASDHWNWIHRRWKTRPLGVERFY